MRITADYLDVCKSIANNSLVLSIELEIKYFYLIQIHISKVFTLYIRNLSLSKFGGKTSQRDIFHHTLLTSLLLRTVVVMQETLIISPILPESSVLIYSQVTGGFGFLTFFLTFFGSLSWQVLFIYFIL